MSFGQTQHILLLRHGETDANAAGHLQGHLPTALNLTGIRQATLLADRLAGYRPPIDVLISSDLPRALQTAAPIASACGLKVHRDRAWRERYFGPLEGKPVGDRELWRVASGEFDPPGAELTTAMHGRILNALVGLPKRHPRAHCIAVVTHGGPVRSILRMFCERRLRRTRGPLPAELDGTLPVIFNCSILHLLARHYRGGARWRVVDLNDTAHLGTQPANV